MPNLIEIFSPFASGFVIAPVALVISHILVGKAANYSLEKEDNATYRIDRLPASVLTTSSPNFEGIKEEVRTTIEEFLNVMENIPHFKIDTFVHNFNETTIIEKKRTFAEHRLHTKKIIINQNVDVRSQLLPLLFDLSSTYETPKILAKGFLRAFASSTPSIGKFLDQAYTAVLCKRYFDLELLFDDEMRIILALFIEKIVGREKMESAFFRGALDEVIASLSKYAPREKAIKTVKQLDHISIAMSSPAVSVRHKSNEVYREIVFSLCKMMITKINEDRLSHEENIANIELINDLLQSEFKAGVINYRTTDDMIEELRLTLRGKPDNASSRWSIR
ncbi:MAG TPA: hypothetical protein DCY94_04605 [Firmicutes bacterium]|nr:hypothetical protein [Bacillota bacterium]